MVIHGWISHGIILSSKYASAFHAECKQPKPETASVILSDADCGVPYLPDEGIHVLPTLIRDTCRFVLSAQGRDANDVSGRPILRPLKGLAAAKSNQLRA